MSWDPAQYERFKQQRAEPFYDLLALIRPVPSGRVVDLGCGTGELTAVLHQRLEARDTVGIDSSSPMLERSRDHAIDGLRFEQRNISGDWGEGWDVIFSNAALQWLGNHRQLFEHIRRRLAAGGQLAVQMPANYDHPSHGLAAELAGESPFCEAMGGYSRQPTVLAAEDYSQLLYDLGFERQHVRLQVYSHVLADTDEVAEWTRGTLLTDYQRRLTPELFEQFLKEYRQRLRLALGERAPFHYPFKRILMWAA